MILDFFSKNTLGDDPKNSRIRVKSFYSSGYASRTGNALWVGILMYKAFFGIFKVFTNLES